MTAALELMWVEGYAAVTVDDICKRAGVKKGSFYYFFDSKADLAVAGLERNAELQKAALDAMFSVTVPPLDRIRQACEAAYRRQVDLKARTGRALGCMLCTIGTEICNRDERLRGKIQELLDRYLKYWESAIRDAQHEGLIEAGDTADKARWAMAYYEGLVSRARLHNDAEILRPLADLVLANLQARQPDPAVV